VGNKDLPVEIYFGSLSTASEYLIRENNGRLHRVIPFAMHAQPLRQMGGPTLYAICKKKDIKPADRTLQQPLQKLEWHVCRLSF